ncbi:hypothetical protein HKX48_006076 [Thoreauomyces humboldtii]|nr:hypothetical protein HKX48_006076 [Thoreauomyces humboldtii]
MDTYMVYEYLSDGMCSNFVGSNAGLAIPASISSTTTCQTLRPMPSASGLSAQWIAANSSIAVYLFTGNCTGPPITVTTQCSKFFDGDGETSGYYALLKAYTASTTSTSSSASPSTSAPAITVPQKSGAVTTLRASAMLTAAAVGVVSVAVL